MRYQLTLDGLAFTEFVSACCSGRYYHRLRPNQPTPRILSSLQPGGRGRGAWAYTVSWFISSLPAYFAQFRYDIDLPFLPFLSWSVTYHTHDRSWRERRDLDLARRAEVSAAKKATTIENAKTYVDEFYENYNAKKDKSLAKTRKEADDYLASREDTSAGGTSWERIAKLVDLSGKGAKGGANGTGKEKFREMLLDLKKDENAPGAKGYWKRIGGGLSS